MPRRWREQWWWFRIKTAQRRTGRWRRRWAQRTLHTNGRKRHRGKPVSHNCDRSQLSEAKWNTSQFVGWWLRSNRSAQIVWWRQSNRASLKEREAFWIRSAYSSSKVRYSNHFQQTWSNGVRSNGLWQNRKLFIYYFFLTILLAVFAICFEWYLLNWKEYLVQKTHAFQISQLLNTYLIY